MKIATQTQAKQIAAKYETENTQDAYLRGFDRGYNCAYWQDLPELGVTVWTESDGKIVVDEENQWDVVQDAAFDAEQNSRQFSPFEFTAAEFNSSEDDSEELWDAFDAGIGDGIQANIAERKAV